MDRYAEVVYLRDRDAAMRRIAEDEQRRHDALREFIDNRNREEMARVRVVAASMILFFATIVFAILATR